MSVIFRNSRPVLAVNSSNLGTYVTGYDSKQDQSIILVDTHQAEFDPANAGTLVAWYTPADPEYAFTDLAGTVAADSANDLVRRFNGRLGTEPYFTVSSDSYRATVQENGLYFNGNEFYISSDQNFWTFMHNGTGAYAFFRLIFNEADSGTIQEICGNINNNNDHIGFWLSIRDDGANSGYVYSYVSKDSPLANGSIAIPAANNARNNTDPVILTWIFESGIAGNDFRYRWNGVDIVGTDSAFTPSNDPPSHNLYLGARADIGNRFLRATIKEILIYSSVDDIEAIEEYISR